MKLFTALILSSAFLTAAASPVFSGTAGKNPLFCGFGEKVRFTIRLLDQGKPVAGRKLQWTRVGDDGVKAEGSAVSDSEKPLVIETLIGKPGFVRVRVVALAENGKDPDFGIPPYEGGAGAGISLLEPAGSSEPSDFDSFWEKRKKLLKNCPMRSFLRPVREAPEGFVVYEFTVNTPGPYPATGYVCIPKGAKNRSLPLSVMFSGYSPVQSAMMPPAEKGAVTATVSTFGLPNGKDDKFYRDAAAMFRLHNYGFTDNADPENSFLGAMLLRDLRALQFLKTNPVWNGRILRVSGGSMGGMQALTMAAQDPDVTSCGAGVPWLADLRGFTMGRMRGHHPDYYAALGYYDSINQAKRVTCPTEIDVHLGDGICPPAGILLLYNALKCPKKITFVQSAGHGTIAPDAERFEFRGPVVPQKTAASLPGKTPRD